MGVDFKFTQSTCGTTPQAKKLTEKIGSKSVKLIGPWQRQTWNYFEGIPLQHSVSRTLTENNPCCR